MACWSSAGKQEGLQFQGATGGAAHLWVCEPAVYKVRINRPLDFNEIRKTSEAYVWPNFQDSEFFEGQTILQLFAEFSLRRDAMTFDYWVELSESTSEPSEGDLPEPSEKAAWNLASGFVDRCVEWAMRGNDQRIESRKKYVQGVASKKAFSLPSELSVLEESRL
jgi:hypothetical protein